MLHLHIRSIMCLGQEISEILSTDVFTKIMQEKWANVEHMLKHFVLRLKYISLNPSTCKNASYYRNSILTQCHLLSALFSEAITILRVLTKCIPIMLETSSALVHDFFWRNDESPDSRPPEPNCMEPCEEEDGEVAVQLVSVLFRLLFLPGFTIPPGAFDEKQRSLNSASFKAAIVWAPGVGIGNPSVNVSSPHDENRIDVLRAMLVLFSECLYQTPEEFDVCANLWLELATGAGVPLTEIALYSMINVALGKAIRLSRPRCRTSFTVHAAAPAPSLSVSVCRIRSRRLGHTLRRPGSARHRQASHAVLSGEPHRAAGLRAAYSGEARRDEGWRIDVARPALGHPAAAQPCRGGRVRNRIQRVPEAPQRYCGRRGAALPVLRVL